ncbi:YwqG family protein [Agarivorans sp. 1_MG-2023]|uniref:YwqG family protein n=1 Tax=Agarivorans sp. 1_MG-2023 TaxID=3062634 RepID=UPI0026E1940B|nr:YwqG family protein [Agarivorans sp. 1_MG-2023]MDO6765770.1 YwqG family protein [Agarivorans sp. 1_MG-2023]
MTTFLTICIALVVAFIVYRIFFGDQTPQIDPEEFEKELRMVDEVVQRNVLESIRILPGTTSPAGSQSSKFGGYPIWPNKLEYPVDKKNKPLRLLAQFNLSELPENGFLPKVGILQFFISDQGSLGLEYESKGRSINDIIEAPTEYRVFYHKTVDESFRDLEGEYPLGKKVIFPFKGEYSLSFLAEDSEPSPTDYRFEKIIGDTDDLHDDTMDALFEKYDSSGCKLGGYANFTQDDPRLAMENEQWLLLFQMDTVTANGVDIMWGDAGVANFFIRPKDLEKEHFSETWFNWDCC